ncbi:hypothetical protein FJ959_17965 [Mesorhizobium sp. B2-2-4]|nr:hypothetical protein FJW11_19985 [Mesorhizobium sp. B3-1-1]TPJ03278.1 hypothetical protein FJ428_18680 [Mesorhizobium sp. B2-8-1]TPJ52835.1 hypothetical protein FJ426_16000 [Mesorhizobium sp. B2-6-4]TPJ61585.1 hypothetical protein FJ462_26865 [Mesorhizobium sp. B2-6-7]TPJ85161.1 hypothetical protein FJ422_14105 [Mesorhizobium sp. B2-6-3]TPJ99420.1 hypothetical protein FJ491_15080 [Mesorhizobium sp. B2-5-10]TPK11137.1 hypothetical protein FJ490_12930 [Mesorhizobium sp. B2-5-11]TPK35881.1 h
MAGEPQQVSRMRRSRAWQTAP